MGKVFFFSFVLTMLFSAQSGARTTYTLADLEILATEGSHEEFFEHALDVRPSERQEAWKAMVSKMGKSFTQSVLAAPEVPKKLYLKTEELYRYPTLREDELFRARRQDIALRFLSHCLKDPLPCWKEVKSFWESDSTEVEVAFKLAELTAKYPNSPFTPWTYLEVALKSPLSEFYCKKEFVMEALWKKLEIDYIRLGLEGDLLSKIDQTIHPDCLGALNQTAKTRLYQPQKSIDRELAYNILKAQGKMDQKESDFFLTVYLLERPSQGELFNYAWNRLKELGSSIQRREEVLKKLKGLDPLPDELLSTLDQKKKRVILSHFKGNFPEYLDFYVNQCLLFYGGKGSFPQGNPTVHCQEFMQEEMAPHYLGSDKIQLYQNIRKI